MKALRAAIEAPTASFRYPHFLVGRQPSYPAPPPATVRGLLAAALGLPACPAEHSVAISFRSTGRVDDLEHEHIVVAGRGKLPGTSLPKAAEATIQPVLREVLCGCRLELTVSGGDLQALAGALRRPAFALSLGRSQDLADVSELALLDLEEDEAVYLQDCLVPGEFRPHLVRGAGLVMALHHGPPPEREPRFARMLWVEGRAALDRRCPVDPAGSPWEGRARGIVFFPAG